MLHIIQVITRILIIIIIIGLLPYSLSVFLTLFKVAGVCRTVSPFINALPCGLTIPEFAMKDVSVWKLISSVTVPQ